MPYDHGEVPSRSNLPPVDAVSCTDRSAVAAGLIPGASIFDSFGERTSVGTTATGEDVWQGTATTIPVPPDVGEQMTLISSDAGDDNVTGQGAKIIRVHYIDAAGDEQYEDVEMDGQVEVDTIATDIRFVQELHATSVGTNGAALGNITIYQKGDNTRIYSRVDLGGNMSLVTNRMVPRGKKLVISGWKATETKAQRCTTRLRSTSHNGILFPGIFIFIDTMTLTDSALRSERAVLIPALAIVKLSCWNALGTAETSAGWEGVLYDE